jgi:hypothetical protein
MLCSRPDPETAARLASFGQTGDSPMPHYFFDIQDGHKLIDPSGYDCEDDAAAIEKAGTLAIGVSLDKPAVDPTRHIAIRNDVGQPVSSVPIYSTPSEEHPAT